MRRSRLVLATVGAWLLASCGSSGGGGSTSAATGSALTTTTWILEPTVLGLPGADRVQPTLQLRDGTASGSSGCNRYHGAYTLSGNSLSFGPMATTNMACGDQETAIERAYLARLTKVATYKLTSSALQLADSKGATVLSYAAANPSLQGDWTVTGYLTSSGTAFSSVVLGSDLTASFAAGGAMSGSTGCNRFTGTWKQGPGDAVAIDVQGQTLAACTNPDLMAQETSIVQAWKTSVTADVAGREATFYNAAGQRTVTATR